MRDTTTGLTYMQARYYDPSVGRFLATDPVQFAPDRPDMFNRYAYAANDPVNMVDPDGNSAVSIAFKVALKGGNVGAALAGVREDVNTLRSADASLGAKAFAVVSLASEAFSPISIKDAKAGANAVQSLRKGTCCFVAGTLVDTAEGLRPIEEIEEGDLVWARNTETGATELKAVTELFTRHERVIWEGSLAGDGGEAELFETTDDHPWWIVDEDGSGRWVTTEDLAPGMVVVSRDPGSASGASGPDGRMVLVSVTETDRVDATYNLTVADFHTYFVGEQRVLVHNCDVKNFDGARSDAFEKAGMKGGDVEFSMQDKTTGTITVFKGAGGAKVGYDGPHPDTPGPHHDTNHVSWQSGGKRGDGMQRGNEPYTGDQHPTRQNSEDLDPQ